jgi:hypothetical protein
MKVYRPTQHGVGRHSFISDIDRQLFLATLKAMLPNEA